MTILVRSGLVSDSRFVLCITVVQLITVWNSNTDVYNEVNSMLKVKKGLDSNLGMGWPSR